MSGNPAPVVIAARFSGSDSSYDYFADFPVNVGDLVLVETKRGNQIVEVVEVKASSDSATKYAIGHA